MDRAQIYRWYEQYKQDIYRYAYAITKDAALAEDVLQDTFVRLLSAAKLPDEDKVRAWLYRVARNLCYDQLRRNKRMQVQPLQEESCQDPYGYIDLIASLSPKDREIVTLKIVGMLTHSQIGEVLGISARAAQKRYIRALAVLRDKEES